MNKIPCASQNMEAKTLPADICVFHHFGWLWPAAVHSADCRFDSGMKYWIHVSSTVTYLSFLLCRNSCKQHSESSTHCCFWSTVTNAAHILNTAFSVTNIHAKWWIHCLLISYATSIYNRPKQVCGVFLCFPGQLLNLGDLSIQHQLCLMTAFKVSISPLNCCFRLSRVWITLIKPLLCLNSIFSPSESNSLLTHEIQIFPLFWKFATVASLK